MALNPNLSETMNVNPGGSVALGSLPSLNLNNPSQQQNSQTPQPLNISTGNPALKALFDSTNSLLNDYQAKGGVITPEIQQRIQAINDAELQKTSAIAQGRSAADNKNASVLDTAMNTASTAENNQQSMLQSLLDELKTARKSYITSLSPTQAETDLQTKLNNLRTERQLLPIELRTEGISAAGIQGRQFEDERVRAIQEQNLLNELGLKQQARQMSSQGFKEQVGFIANDVDLQMKIQQQLANQENKIVEQARNLRKDSIAALSNIVESFKGLAFSDLDPQTQSDLLDTAKQFEIPANLLASAMENAKRQQVFTNSLAITKATNATEKPPTAAQQTLSGYAVRIEQSNPILKNLENDIANMSYLKYVIQTKLPSTFQDSKYRQFDQASRNFINAVLRRESGAAIAQSEFDNAKRQYLPQPGDDAKTLAQKEQNRNLVFQNFKQGAGNAYSSVEDLLKGTATPLNETETYVTPDGTEYVKGEDGTYYQK